MKSRTADDDVVRPNAVVRGSRLGPSLLVAVAVLLLLAGGIEWSEQVGQNASASLRTSGADFTDFDALVKRLRTPHDTDRVSRFVWSELSPTTRSALTSSSVTHPSRAVREALLAADLNRIIESGFSIYEPAGFQKDTGWLKTLRLRLHKATALGPPAAEDSQLIVVHLGNPPTFRIVEYPERHEGNTVIPPQHVPLAATELFREQHELDSLLEVLHLPELATYHDKPTVDSAVAAAHLPGLVAFLGYTGLGTDIDHYLRKGKLRTPSEDRWLNRLLLQLAYPKEIRRTVQFDSHDVFGLIGREFARYFAADIPVVIRSQVWTICILALLALIPALAGLIFRRAFWSWFLGAFVILSTINIVAALKGWGHVAASMTGDLMIPYTQYLWAETLLLMLLLLFRLQRHSAAMLDEGTRRSNIIVAAVLALGALAWLVLMWQRSTFDVLQVLGATTMLIVVRALFVQSRRAVRDRMAPAKNIVVCLDGTWNQPGTKDFGHVAETNVFKLYRMLRGKKAHSRYNASRSREYLDDVGKTRQIAFYYHGVGNTMENSEIGQVFGGAFGMGADAIVERAYLDVVRVYRPGDRIFIFGFSRGAAIARLLAGVIGRRDIPRSLWTLRVFGRHWLVRRSSRRIDEQNPVPVEVLGCWDTVGAFGIAKNILGIPFQRINLLKDLSVSICVKRAYHMVALDETRDAFEPTLMEPDPTSPNRVVEVWFSGNHANVGGGYSTDNLSDLTLDFLLRHISSGYAWRDDMEPGRDESWGLYLDAARRGIPGAEKAAAVLEPDPCGQLRHATGPLYTYVPRALPINAVVHDSVFERMANALPVYAPPNIFALNERLVTIRSQIDTEVRRLADTHSIDASLSTAIIDRSAANLFLMKWSTFLESSLSDGVPLRAKLRSAEELQNPA